MTRRVENPLRVSPGVDQTHAHPALKVHKGLSAANKLADNESQLDPPDPPDEPHMVGIETWLPGGSITGVAWRVALVNVGHSDPSLSVSSMTVELVTVRPPRLKEDWRWGFQGTSVNNSHNRSQERRSVLICAFGKCILVFRTLF